MNTLTRWACAALLAYAPMAAMAAPPKPAYVTGSPVTGAIAKASGPQSVTTGDLSGDCTTSATLAITCTKTNATPFGTFATQNYATPPAIGGTTPAAGAFTTLSATGNLTTNVTGSTQCIQASSSGVLSGTGSACGSGGGGLSSGTSFPGSPSTNDLFYRTDRALLYYYDGTRWLTVNQYTVQVANSDALNPRTATTPGGWRATLPGSGLYAFWAETAVFTGYLVGATTWTYQLDKYDGSTATSLATASTSGDGVGYTTHRVAIGASIASTASALQGSVTLVSGVQALYVSMTLVGRMIG